jgi:hypothetical protein
MSLRIGKLSKPYTFSPGGIGLCLYRIMPELLGTRR